MTSLASLHEVIQGTQSIRERSMQNSGDIIARLQWQAGIENVVFPGLGILVLALMLVWIARTARENQRSVAGFCALGLVLYLVGALIGALLTVARIQEPFALRLVMGIVGICGGGFLLSLIARARANSYKY